MRTVLATVLALLTLAASAQAYRLEAPVAYPADVTGNDLVVAHFDSSFGDDVAAIGTDGAAVVLPGLTTEPKLAAPLRSPLGIPSPTALAAGDVDHDGTTDLAAVNDTGRAVSVVLGRGDGTFGPPATITLPTRAASVAVGDVDGDFRAEIVVGARDVPGVTVVRLGATGALTASPIPTATAKAGALAVSDLDGDRRGDIAFVAEADDQVDVLFSDAGGTFTRKTFAAGPAPRGLAAGPFSTPTNPELIVTRAAGGITVLRPAGARDLGTSSIPGSGASRVAIGSVGWENRAILLPDGGVWTGGTTPQTSIPATFTAMAIGDQNGDGGGDVFFLRPGSSAVWLAHALRGLVPFPSELNGFTKRSPDATMPSQQVIVANQGVTPVTFRSVGIDVGSTAFTILANTGCGEGATLQPGAQCTIEVGWADTRTTSGALAIRADEFPGSALYVGLRPTANTSGGSPPSDLQVVGTPKEGETVRCFDGAYDLTDVPRRVRWQTLPFRYSSDGAQLKIPGYMAGAQLQCRTFADYFLTPGADSPPVTVQPVDADRTPPTGALRVVRSAGGVTVTVTCSETCRADAVALTGTKQIGRATGSNDKPFTIRLASTRGPFTVDVRIMDGSGNSRRLTKTIDR